MSNIEITEKLRTWLIDNHHCPSTLTEEKLYGDKVAELIANDTLSLEKFIELMEDDEMSESPNPEKLFDQGNGGHVNVKAPSEKYSEKRYTANHVKTGKPVFDAVHQQECQSMSEAASARHGVLLKHLANRAGINCPLSEHERSLLDEVCQKQTWCGKIGSEFYDEIGGHSNVKAILDDTVVLGSGGLEIVPIEFDSDIISFPLLTGELYPLVDIHPVSRGRRIEGASIGTPTLAWGGGDGTQITVFTTTAMVNPLDTDIFVADGAIEIGRDFLSDSPVAVGSVLTGLVGERLQNELDLVIANGNGTTQPTGIFQAAGVGAVVTANGAAGPPTLGDFTNLMFGVDKQYRRPNLNPTYISNDTTYARSRQIAVDPAAVSTDQRPVLADVNSFSNYQSLGWKHAVENNLTNPVACFCAMKKYRLYRRIGLEIRFETGGSYLATRNLALLVYRARYGGRLMDANACARWANGQA